MALVDNTWPPLVIPTLDLPKTEHLQDLSPETNRRVEEGLLVRVDDGSFPDEVRLVWADEMRALDELPENEEDRRHELQGVVLEECGYGPRVKGGVAVEEYHDDHEGQRDNGAPRLEPAGVW